MSKDNAKKVTLDEVRKIQEILKDLHEALVIHSETETNGMAKACAKHVQKLTSAAKTALAGIKKVAAKK